MFNKMKMYRGRKRIALKGVSMWWRNRIKLAMTLQPGDYVFICRGYNTQIARIEFQWVNAKLYTLKGRTSKQGFIHEVLIVDTKGYHHWVSGPSCVNKPEDIETLREQIKRSARVLKEIGPAEEQMKWINAVENGVDIFDQYGEPLPEFDDRIKQK